MRWTFSVFNVSKNNSKNINRNTLMEKIFEGRISRGSSLSAKFLVLRVIYFQGVNISLFSKGIFFRGYYHNV